VRCRHTLLLDTKAGQGALVVVARLWGQPGELDGVQQRRGVVVAVAQGPIDLRVLVLRIEGRLASGRRCSGWAESVCQTHRAVYLDRPGLGKGVTRNVMSGYMDPHIFSTLVQLAQKAFLLPVNRQHQPSQTRHRARHRAVGETSIGNLPMSAMLALDRSHQVGSVELADSNSQRSEVRVRVRWRVGVAGIAWGQG